MNHVRERNLFLYFTFRIYCLLFFTVKLSLSGNLTKLVTLRLAVRCWMLVIGLSPFLWITLCWNAVLGYWINTMSQWIFGNNSFSARFWSVFSITLSALLVAWLAWSMWHKKRVAILSAVIFLTTFLVYGIGTDAVFDPMITLWLILAMCAFWRIMQAVSAWEKISGYITLGVACGLDIMTKGFLALVVSVVAIFPWIIIHPRWIEVLTWGWLSVISTILVILPWALAITL